MIHFLKGDRRECYSGLIDAPREMANDKNRHSEESTDFHLVLVVLPFLDVTVCIGSFVMRLRPGRRHEMNDSAIQTDLASMPSI
jgi:hypothetical protein